MHPPPSQWQKQAKTLSGKLQEIRASAPLPESSKQPHTFGASQEVCTELIRPSTPIVRVDVEPAHVGRRLRLVELGLLADADVVGFAGRAGVQR